MRHKTWWTCRAPTLPFNDIQCLLFLTGLESGSVFYLTTTANATRWCFHLTLNFGAGSRIRTGAGDLERRCLTAWLYPLKTLMLISISKSGDPGHYHCPRTTYRVFGVRLSFQSCAITLNLVDPVGFEPT